MAAIKPIQVSVCTQSSVWQICVKLQLLNLLLFKLKKQKSVLKDLRKFIKSDRLS